MIEKVKCLPPILTGESIIEQCNDVALEPFIGLFIRIIDDSCRSSSSGGYIQSILHHEHHGKILRRRRIIKAYR